MILIKLFSCLINFFNDIKLYEFESCGASDTCAQFILNSYPNFRYLKNTVLVADNFVEGPNTYYLPNPIKVKNGFMLGVIHQASSLALDMSNNNMRSDFIIIDTNILPFSYDYNYRFYVNAITTANFYYTSFYYSKAFVHSLNQNTYENRNLVVEFFNSNINLTRQIKITDGRLIFKLN